MKNLSRIMLVSALVLGLCAQAYAGLLINPKRIVLADKERNATLDLMNEGSSVARYQIFFEQKMMNADGAIVDQPVTDNSDSSYFAKDMIRYSPRRVDIQPGATQTIRLAVRRPRDLSDGEYISHLVFKEIPAKVEAGDQDQPEDKKLKLAFRPTLKIAIPIIVRKGELQAKTTMSQIAYTPETGNHGELSFKLERSGLRSLYGDVEIFEMADGLTGKRVGLARGIALYTTTPDRRVKVPLSGPLAQGVSSLRVSYDEGGKYGGQNRIETMFVLP